MISLSSMLTRRRRWSFTMAILLTTGFFGELAIGGARAQETNGPCEEGCTKRVPPITDETDVRDDTDFIRLLRDVADSGFGRISAFLGPKLLQANVRTECSLALLRTALAFKKLEPWALRLFDATGKYPSGLLQMSRVDIGAFDECIETKVRDNKGRVQSRGQYCNLQINLKNQTTFEWFTQYFASAMHPKINEFKGLMADIDDHLIRIGICFLDDCNEEDLQVVVDTMTPSLVRAEVVNCVTAEPEPWSRMEIVIVTILGFLAIVVCCATAFDVLMLSNEKRAERSGLLFRIVCGFSVVANTRHLCTAGEITPGRYSLRFLHGIRALSMTHIVLGHCYAVSCDIWARELNLLIFSEWWPYMWAAAGFCSVDTFFFLSGFLLALTIAKRKRNGPVVFLITVVRRLIRTCVPLFFVIMCFCVLPRFVTGPDVKEFFAKFYGEIVRDWWRFLIQIKNFSELSMQEMFTHVWYLSADFQLFVISLLVLLILRRWKTMMLGAFALLSLLGCAASAWVASDSEILPFMTIPARTASSMLATFTSYYVRPSYHAVCYFSGCMTFLLLDDFKKWQMSRGVQLVGWSAAVGCLLCSVFMKFPWYASPDPPLGVVKLLAAFFDRIMWSFFLAWVALTCSGGHGGIFTRFLSWNVFVPLSKLTYGSYLIHYPFLMLMLHASRERLFFSPFTQVTLFFSLLAWTLLLAYAQFLACEAPVAAVVKLVFDGLAPGETSAKKTEPPPQGAGGEDTGGISEGGYVPSLWTKL